MLEIKKTKSELGIYDISLIDSDNIFKIMFGSSGDLYWYLYDKNNTKVFKKCKTGKFYITKENYEIYELFNQLYNDIKECNVFNVDEWDMINCGTEEIKEKYTENQQSNNLLKKGNAYKLLFNNNIISWHSDDCLYGDANIVNIIKDDEQFILDFHFLQESSIFMGSSIRFRNSGSTYSPFNIIFMRMYNKLQNYDAEYHQIHLEEYNYQKTKK